jgi:hypothetical protein
MNFKTVTKIAATLAVISFMSVAKALSLSDAGVVGKVVPGTPASVTEERGYVNKLLSMGANQSTTLSGNTYTTGATDYNGTVTGGTQNNTGSNAGATSFLYVLAKYGQDSWVFNMNDFAGNIPLNIGTGGQLSHYTGFGTRTTTVPDGGATVALLGVGLLGLGAVRRKLS